MVLIMDLAKKMSVVNWRSLQQYVGLILLLVMGFVGNYCRWTLFFDIDFIFGSIAVWIVVCLYGVRWGTLAGFIAGYCTYVIWHHPYTTLTFTVEALFVGWLFHKRQQNNIVLLDGLFWLVIGMPLIWLFYSVILKFDQPQFLIILMKQPVNGIFNALIASLILTHSPIHHWVKRPAAISTLSLEQTLFNLLVTFVSVPTLVLIVLASNQVVDEIKNTARLDLNDASRYLTAEVRTWYERRLSLANGLAELAATNIQDSTLRQRASFMSLTFPEFQHIHILDAAGNTIFDFDQRPSLPKVNFNEDDYFAQLQRSPQPILSPVVLQPSTSDFPIALLSVPIMRDGKMVGAVFSEIDLSGITNLLRSNLGEEYLAITLLDQQQTVASSTHPELIGTLRFDWRKDGQIAQIDAQTYHWLPTTVSRLVLLQWHNSLFVKEFRPSQAIPWTMVVQMTASSHVQHIEKIHTRNMALLLMVSGLALVFATLVSSRLVKPLTQLAEITTNLPNKLLDQEPIYWLRSPITELAILVRNFRSMAFSLQQKFREINQANELLELRVKERTQALQETNTELEIEIKERYKVEKYRDRLIESLQISEAQVRQLNAELEERVIQRTAQLESANKELESFSYSVSHDLRAPLRAIDGFSRILQEDYSSSLDNEANRYLKIVRDNVKRMGELIDDLLNLARLSRKEISLQTISQKDLIDRLIKDLSSSWADRQIEFAIITDLPPCQADSSLLTQVWINLLSNAIKYTSKIDHAHIEIGYTSINSEIVYFIRDNGAGFDMQYADKLFGVFQRMHLDNEFEGTGIGLAIVQRIIHRHGGRIWAEAAVNQGATFHFTIPDPIPNYDRST